MFSGIVLDSEGAWSQQRWSRQTVQTKSNSLRFYTLITLSVIRYGSENTSVVITSLISQACSLSLWSQDQLSFLCLLLQSKTRQWIVILDQGRAIYIWAGHPSAVEEPSWFDSSSQSKQVEMMMMMMMKEFRDCLLLTTSVCCSDHVRFRGDHMCAQFFHFFVIILIIILADSSKSK